MPTLTVWKYDTAFGADQGELTLKRLVEQEALVVHDAVTVIWPNGADSPRVHRMHSRRRKLLAGSFWGLLLGGVFTVPVVGVAAGVAVAAARTAGAPPGVDPEVVARLRAAITPGTSALFALTSDADPERVAAAIRGHHAELIHTTLNAEDEEAWRELLGES